MSPYGLGTLRRARNEASPVRVGAHGEGFDRCFGTLSAVHDLAGVFIDHVATEVFTRAHVFVRVRVFGNLGLFTRDHWVAHGDDTVRLKADLHRVLLGVVFPDQADVTLFIGDTLEQGLVFFFTAGERLDDVLDVGLQAVLVEDEQEGPFVVTEAFLKRLGHSGFLLLLVLWEHGGTATAFYVRVRPAMYAGQIG